MPTKDFIFPFIERGGVYRPYVPIKITNPIEKISTNQFGILDTGADSCVFPKIIADSTHHNLKADGVESDINQGVGSESVHIWKHTFIISLYSPDLKKIVWEGNKSLINCLDHNSTPPILGFSDFLSFFSIRFNYSKKIIEINIVR